MNPEEIPLRDLRLPEMTGWWPLAPGWWVLIGLAGCGLLYLLWRAFRIFQSNAPRRKALSQLRYLKAEYSWSGDVISLGIQLSELLRRAMLAYAPRDEVAGLTGTSWLEWLDRGLSDRAFTEGPGRNIESLPYQKPDVDGGDIDIDGLIEAVRQRLKTPLAESV
ncbi:MAG: DUF4381 domain-containing protein [Gammaproteobacteria bacterium]